MLISWDNDMLPVSCATRWETGAVEVTHGHELLAAAVPVGCAAAAGTAINPARATATVVVTSRRRRCLPPPGGMRRTSAPVIWPPPLRSAFPSRLHVILCAVVKARQACARHF